MLAFDKIKQQGLTLDLERVAAAGYDALTPDDHYRLKTYGVCAQRHYGYFMVRIRVPHGQCSVAQARTLADVADRFANEWLHVTTRMDIQLHSVTLDDVPALLDTLESVGLTTRSSCGHTFRNIMGCHRAGTCSAECDNVRPWVDLVHRFVTDHADHFNTTLPSRLNVYFGGCDECMTHLQINDIGLRPLPTEKNTSKETQFELWLGGSLGRANPTIAVRFPDRLRADEILPMIFAVAELHSAESKRHPYQGRLKYLMQKLGHDTFIERVRQRFIDVQTEKDFSIYDVPTIRVNDDGLDDSNWATHLESLPGAQPQRQRNHWRVAGMIERGDITSRQLRSLANLTEEYAAGHLQWTPEQNVEIPHVPTDSVADVANRLCAIGLHSGEERKLRDVLVCPGTEYCSLAITASPIAAASIQAHLPRKWRNDPLVNRLRIHISGCMNSCAQHQAADIGLSGTMIAVKSTRRFTYQLWLGGSLSTDPARSRVAQICRKGITEEQIVPTVVAILECYESLRQPDEPFAETIHRMGVKTFAQCLDDVCPPTPSDQLYEVPITARPAVEAMVV